MAVDIAVNGNTKVKTLKTQFQNKYGVNIRVYKGQKFADDDATMASIRKDGVSGKGEIDINGNMHVGNIEKKFMETLGVKIQIENKEGKLADNKVSLASLNKSETVASTPTASSTSAALPNEAKKGCMGILVLCFIPIASVLTTLYYFLHA